MMEERRGPKEAWEVSPAKKDQAGDLRQKCTNLGREQEENI